MDPVTAPEAIVAGIEALHAERAAAAARIAEIDTTLHAIATKALEGIATLTVEDGASDAEPEETEPEDALDDDEEAADADPPDALAGVKTRILSALKKTRTPMSPKALREAIHRDPTTTREAIKALEAEGLIVVTGATATRRIALA